MGCRHLTAITALSVATVVMMLGCTPGDVATEPESIPSAAVGGHALTPVDLGIPEFYSFANALNNSGQVVGERGAVLDGPGRAFLWTRGKVSDLGTFGGPSSRAFGINDRGQVVGDATTGGGQTHAFLWERDRIRDLGALAGDWSTAIGVNNRGQVIGNSMTSGGEVRGILWQHGSMIDLGTLGGVATYPSTINDKGEIVGSSLTTIEHSPGRP
jgi:probable HAF family extracellular repeat protein